MNLPKRSCLLFAAGLATITLPAHGAPATRLVVSNDFCLIIPCPIDVPPSTTVGSGVSFDIAVAAHDSGNAIDTQFTGTAVFSSSDQLATLPSAYTFVPADRGGKGFFVTLRTPGVQTITVSDPANVLASGTMTMTVTGPAAVNTPVLSDSLKLALAAGLGLAGFFLLRTRS